MTVLMSRGSCSLAEANRKNREKCFRNSRLKYKCVRKFVLRDFITLSSQLFDDHCQ